MQSGNYMDIDSILLPSELQNYVDRSYMYSCFGVPAAFSFGQSAIRDLAATVFMSRKLGLYSHGWKALPEDGAFRVDSLVSISGLLETKQVKDAPTALPAKAKKKLAKKPAKAGA